MKTQVIVLHPDDNVGTSVEDLAAGDIVRIGERQVRTGEPIPFGHKIALLSISAGDPILKYGESIGVARGDIAQGACVHVHNVESQRGRGDLGAAR